MFRGLVAEHLARTNAGGANEGEAEEGNVLIFKF